MRSAVRRGAAQRLPVRDHRLEQGGGLGGLGVGQPDVGLDRFVERHVAEHLRQGQLVLGRGQLAGREVVQQTQRPIRVGPARRPRRCPSPRRSAGGTGAGARSRRSRRRIAVVDVIDVVRDSTGRRRGGRSRSRGSHGVGRALTSRRLGARLATDVPVPPPAGAVTRVGRRRPSTPSARRSRGPGRSSAERADERDVPEPPRRTAARRGRSTARIPSELRQVSTVAAAESESHRSSGCGRPAKTGGSGAWRARASRAASSIAARRPGSRVVGGNRPSAVHASRTPPRADEPGGSAERPRQPAGPQEEEQRRHSTVSPVRAALRPVAGCRALPWQPVPTAVAAVLPCCRSRRPPARPTASWKVAARARPAAMVPRSKIEPRRRVSKPVSEGRTRANARYERRRHEAVARSSGRHVLQAPCRRTPGRPPRRPRGAGGG